MQRIRTLLAVVALAAVSVCTAQQIGCANDQRARVLQFADDGVVKLSEVKTLIRQCAEGSTRPASCEGATAGVEATMSGFREIQRAEGGAAPSIPPPTPIEKGSDQ